jgi:hypothetical protein
MVVKILSFIFLFCSIFIHGQEYTIRGQINDSQNFPIAYANVVISKVDAVIILGDVTTENGSFIIKNVKEGTYVLTISFLGFETYKESIIVDKNLNLEVLKLKESAEELKGITVIAQRPTIKRLIDRVVFNVENSTLSDNNVLDVLKYTPGVLVNNEEITVKNGKPTVYINDKRVHLSASEVLQLLEGTPANNIKSIEVITNPPAKYDAEGGAVLNIVTKKNIIAGYNGSVFGNYKQGSEFPKYSLGTSHFFKTKKLSTYFNFNVSPRKDYQNNTEFINFINGDVVSSWETNYQKTKRTANQNINANIDYELDKNNTLSFSTNMLLAPRDYTKTGVNSFTEVYDANRVLDSTFHSINQSVDEVFNLAFTLDYVHKFKTDGEELRVSMHHTNYDFSSFQVVNTGYFLPNANVSFRDNKFQTFNGQVIKLYTSQLDYELPINQSAHFESGMKVSDINSKSILLQYIFENDIRLEDIANSDTFFYDEMNFAAYSSFSKDWDTWSLKTGLRVEYTDITGNSMSTNQDNNQDYIKFFPSLYILNKLDDKNEWYFKYNRRIYRPRYEELNPFKFFINDNAFITGDPKLKPQVDDIFTLGYTFNKKYTFELYYRNENNSTLNMVFQDNINNKIKYLNTNIDRSVSYGVDFTAFSQVLNRWNLYAFTSLFYYEDRFFALESNDTLQIIDKWSVYTEIGNYFSFLNDKSLTMDISLLYISPVVNAPSIISEIFSLDINLRKSLWENRASLSIGITDIFNTKNYNKSTKYLNQDIFLQHRFENRLFTVGFNYKFGNDKLSIKKRNDDLEERERLNSKKDNGL